MTRDTQEYINSLINKPRIYFLDLNNWNLTKNQSEGDRQLKGEINDLKDFQNLKGINVSNNELNNLNFLDTLPNKDKLKGINLYGNQITEVDFAELFTKFPNLEKINLANNPLSAKNLSNLTNEQFGKLIEGIKNKTIKINSFKGTILADLFAYV
ncbi:MAG: leucine-rich repeat domain-containing protein, partial [Spiroplasmataceae bacterium]|nr:leucine-rich repeat domain-containing protein [Spiroplasmataceae bacterium]